MGRYVIRLVLLARPRLIQSLPGGIGMSYKNLIKLGFIEFTGTHTNPFVGPKLPAWCPVHGAIHTRTMATRIDIVNRQQPKWEVAFMATLITQEDIDHLVTARLITGAPSLRVSVAAQGKRKRSAHDEQLHDIVQGIQVMDATATVPRKRRTLLRAESSRNAAATLRDESPSGSSGTEDLEGSDLDIGDHDEIMMD